MTIWSGVNSRTLNLTPAFARGANSIGAGSGVKNLREWRGSKQALRLVIHGNLVQVHVVVARVSFVLASGRELET